jgi:hypothetical protein
MTKPTLAALYDTYDHAKSTVSDLESAGIPHSDISIVANKQSNTATGAEAGGGVGAVVGGGAGLLAGLGMLAIPGVGPVVAAGWLVATAAGAAVGATAGAAESGVSKEHAQVYAEGVRRGGSLVSVKCQTEQSGLVRTILDRHHPINPEVRGAAYRKSGWTKFDEKAPVYTTAELERERTFY